MPTTQNLTRAAAAFALFCTASAAFAHPGFGPPDSIASGLIHPLTGADHLLAMIASGLLAVRLGTRRALWGIPATFIGAMLLGALASAVGMRLPHAEWAISASVIVLGLLVALRPRVDLRVALSIVGVAAFFHGHAHASEFAGSSMALYMTGFTLSTLALHAGAIALGLGASRFLERPLLVRAAGATIAAGFASLLFLS